MKIGLFFGSFNPIHIGHLIIANQVLAATDLKKVWFVVSPQNPLKEKSSLLNEYHRLHLVTSAVEDNPKLKASKIEFDLPKPSYTIDTLMYLKEKYPQHEFCLIMGSDNLATLNKWKNAEQLLKQHEILVYKRNTTDAIPAILKPFENKITMLDVPLLQISSTLIRQLIKEKKSIKYLVPDKVAEQIAAGGYFK